ncbi:hypothetical protein SINU_01970 [Sporolactobacillus inulinus CASD]|uniref:Uncharacterized protein n=2 Tax=Sporolactobacillus inulinus TaxID=2078 RepID=A0A0U1QS16_9BACL|nr:hypothetical protein SINU_01970 [Sporolactobacillus inulinus CASD]
MIESIKSFMGWFFVTGDPMIYGADASIALVSIGIVAVLTYFKKWKWLWEEWLTTVDHKKIGIILGYSRDFSKTLKRLV